MQKIKFRIKNLTCKACVKLSKIRLEKIEGVQNVQIDGLEGKTEIAADREIPLEEIQAALSGTDYKITKIY